MGNLISFMKNVANGLRESGNYGTAHIYRSSMSAVISFHGSDKLPFRKVTQEFLKSFESYLRGRNCSWNTVSTYMRTLRAVYNRAVDRELISGEFRLFSGLKTGVTSERKLAVTASQMNRLLNPPTTCNELPKEVCQAQDSLKLMLLLQGMPYADLAHLHKKDIQGDLLTCRRRDRY